MSNGFDILLGYFDGNELLIWIFVQFGLVILFILNAYRIFIKQNPYSMMTHSISFLGSWIPTRNPKGWWNLSIALGILSIFFIPLTLYYHRNMESISVWGAYVGTILNFIGLIGIFLVAVFPDNEGMDFFKDLSYGKIHNTVAALGFGGFGFGNLWFGLLFLYDALWGSQIYNPARFLPPFVILFILVLIIAYTQLKWEKISQKDKTKTAFPGEGIYSFPLWEWILATYMFIAVYFVLLSF